MPRLGGGLWELVTSWVLFNDAALLVIIQWICSALKAQCVQEGTPALYLCWSTPPPAGSCTAPCSSSWGGCTPPGTGRRRRSSPHRTHTPRSRSSRDLKGDRQHNTQWKLFVCLSFAISNAMEWLKAPHFGTLVAWLTLPHSDMSTIMSKNVGSGNYPFLMSQRAVTSPELLATVSSWSRPLKLKISHFGHLVFAPSPIFKICLNYFTGCFKHRAK